MNSMRKDCLVGIIEYDDGFDSETKTLHFSEWWNGEGVTFDFNSGGKDEKTISLHQTEIVAMVTAAIASKMVSVKTCKAEAKAMNK